MNSEKLMDAIGNIDLEIVERFILMDLKLQNKEHVHKRKTWISIAACLGLCVALSLSVAAVVKHLQSTKVPISQEPVYSAEEIGAMFGTSMGTSFYQKIYVSSAEELQGAPIPEEEYIAVYENNLLDRELDEEELRRFVDGFSDRLSEALGSEMPECTIDNWSETLHIKELFGYADIGAHKMGIQQTRSRNRFYMFSSRDEEGNFEQIILDGQVVQVDQRQSDEEIIESLSEIKKKLFKIFGVKYKDVKVVRVYDKDSEYGVNALSVYFYNADAHPLNELAEMPVTDYIEIRFDNRKSHVSDIISDGVLTDATIFNIQTRYKDIYQPVVQCRRISLSEAEALLAKGYVFGGHSCPLCMVQQDPVDFTQYDFVGLTYLFEGIKAGGKTTKITAIPFYVFYKYIGDSENGNQSYAMTYVPAIEVSGWDEYFENQMQNHKNYKMCG